MPELSAPILVPAIRLDRDDGEEEARALARARQPWVAGFLLFGGEVRQVERLTDALRHEAGRPIFISSDMERGAGQQIRGLTSLPDLGLLGLAGNPADAAAFGEITAREARSVGVDVIFAPVVDVRSEIDNPIVGTRALGFDAARVALLASAFCDGIHAGGALAVAKHFPGHGATREDSHDAVPTVTDSAALLELRDLRPFRELVQAENCAAVMTAHVAYPALDPSGVIATFSKPILARTPLIVFTDALTMAGANEGIGEVEAARRALRAGCHALLYPAEPERVAATLLDGAEEVHNLARLAAARLAPLSAGDKASVPLGSALTPELSARPASVAVRAVNLSMGGAAVRKPDVLWIIDDDGLEGRGLGLAERAREAGVACQVVSVPAGEHAHEVSGPKGLAAIVVMASIRAWKGAAGVSEEGLRAVLELTQAIQAHVEQTVVVWCAPAAPLESRPERLSFHLPGTGPHLETALADVLFTDT